MKKVVITGTGLWSPDEVITNDELVASFNQYVDQFNAEHKEAIAAGEVEALVYSDSAFIEKASGITQRRVLNKSGILDPQRLAPYIPERSDDEISVQAEMAVKAANQALQNASLTANDIDGVIVACSNMQRPYPAMAIEVQHALGMEHGWGYDMNVACSSATFGIQAAADAVRNGSARRVLMVNPEICSAHLAFEDRDCHFIFGDVATAVIVEATDTAKSTTQWEVVSTRLQTKFSNNIRNNFGFLNRCDETGVGKRDKLFMQQGRKVFREVCPMVATQINDHLSDENITVDQLKRLWLHQANLSMDELIAKRILGRTPTEDEMPIILDQYANTSSAGSIIAFHCYQQGMASGDLGVICSFGAGYSIGSVIVRKV